MTDTLTLRRHAALVDRMSGVLGLDLEERMMRGQMQIDTLGDAVLACTGCTDANACDRWLAAQEQGGEVAARAPAQCRNSALFEELKDGRRV